MLHLIGPALVITHCRLEIIDFVLLQRLISDGPIFVPIVSIWIQYS